MMSEDIETLISTLNRVADSLEEFVSIHREEQAKELMAKEEWARYQKGVFERKW